MRLFSSASVFVEVEAFVELTSATGGERWGVGAGTRPDAGGASGLGLGVGFGEEDC